MKHKKLTFEQRYAIEHMLKKLEAKTGKKVVSTLNAKTPGKKKIE